MYCQFNLSALSACIHQCLLLHVLYHRLFTNSTIAFTDHYFLEMAGVGRRSQYRKHLTGSLLTDFPVPDFTRGERIAKVYSSRGGNQFDILLADPPQITSPPTIQPSNHDENERVRGERVPQLAILPNKFHKLVWVKRNDFVIVRGSQEESAISKVECSSGIRYMITHVLYKDQVKYLKEEGCWPTNDLLFSEIIEAGNDDVDGRTRIQQELAVRYNTTCGEMNGYDEDDSDEESSDNIHSNDEDTSRDHDEYLVNTNRLARIRIVDSDDEDSSDE